VGEKRRRTGKGGAGPKTEGEKKKGKRTHAHEESGRQAKDKSFHGKEERIRKWHPQRKGWGARRGLYKDLPRAFTSFT